MTRSVPTWATPEGVGEVQRQRVLRDFPRLRPIAPPVDVSDAAAFPNIAAAIEHARKPGMGEG